jgi:hypothetical protein
MKFAFGKRRIRVLFIAGNEGHAEKFFSGSLALWQKWRRVICALTIQISIRGAG